MGASTNDPRLQEKSKISRRALLGASGAVAVSVASPKIFNEPRAMAAGVQVSHGHSVSFNWNIKKDSPDGTKVLYVTFPSGNPAPGSSNYPLGPAEIWYASPTGTGRTKVIGGGLLANNHTGLNQRWIDNQRIVYRHHTTTQKHTKVININGTVVQNWSNLQGVVPIGYSGGINKIVAGRRAGDGGPLSDVWLLDPNTGAANKIFDTSALTPWQTMLGGVPADWSLWHRYFSKGGGLIWIKIEAPNGAFGFTFNTSGGNIIHYNAPNAGSHNTWWDTNRIFHVFGSTIQIRSRNGSVSESGPLAGKSNHIGLSNDRTLIVSDWFGHPSPNKVRVQLFQKGNTTPLTTLFATPYVDIVNGSGRPHGALAHPNPSFSRDGQRVYAVQPVAENSTRLMMYDISQWA